MEVLFDILGVGLKLLCDVIWEGRQNCLEAESNGGHLSLVFKT